METSNNYIPAVFIRKIVPVSHQSHWSVWVQAETLNKTILCGNCSQDLAVIIFK